MVIGSNWWALRKAQHYREIEIKENEEHSAIKLSVFHYELRASTCFLHPLRPWSGHGIDAAW